MPALDAPANAKRPAVSLRNLNLLLVNSHCFASNLTVALVAVYYHLHNARH